MRAMFIQKVGIIDKILAVFKKISSSGQNAFSIFSQNNKKLLPFLLISV